MVYCKKVTYDSGRGVEHPAIILGKVETIREGLTTFKRVTTGKGVKEIRNDMIIKIEDTNEIFQTE